MKIAALYDIHGNLTLLDAVLAELEEVQPDVIVVGGDIVSGPQPEQTLERLLALGDRVCFIRGNADREVAEAGSGLPPHPDSSEQERETTAWVAGQFTGEQRDFLFKLPEHITLYVDQLGEVLFCHATPRSDLEIFTPLTPQERLDGIFVGVEQPFVVCGHTHTQFERTVGSTRILNAGSVGMPYEDQRGTYWLLLSEQGYEFRRTEYDVELVTQAVRASGYPNVEAFIETYIAKPPTAAEATEFFESVALSPRWSYQG